MEDQPVPAANTTNRGKRPAPRGTAAYQRKRAVRACQVCRARRTKCDNLKPSCSFCLKVGAKCIQSPADLSSFDPASLRILDRLDDLETLMRDTEARQHSERALGTSSTPVDTSDGEATESAEPVCIVTPDMVIPPGQERVISWPVLTRLCANALDGYEFQHFHDHMSAHISSPAVALGILEEPRHVKELLDNFFSYVHTKNPILNETVTREMVHSTAMNGIDWSPESCLSLLIFALGTIATPFGPSHSTMPGNTAYAQSQSYFSAAQKRIGSLITLDDKIAPQCLFLAGVFMMCTFKPEKAWRFFVQALAGCQHFDFLASQSQPAYQDAASQTTRLDTHPPDSSEQAIYWSSWKSERELRNDSELQDFPKGDSGASLYPPFFPTPPLPRNDDVPRHTRQEREQTSWYFYLAEISLRRLSARIAAEMVAFQKENSARQQFLIAMAAAIPSYEDQIEGWISSLPSCLSFQAPANEDDVCTFVLRGHIMNLTETIYWPFVAACLDSQSMPSADGQNGFEDLTQKGLSQHVLRIEVNKPGFEHRHHGTHPLMRSCSRSGLVLMAAAAKASTGSLALPSGMPSGWRQAVRDVVYLLKFWSMEARGFDRTSLALEEGLMQLSDPLD